MQNFIFDSHAHYDDEAFEEDRHQVIQSLQQKGVCNVINVGANLERSKDSIALAAQYPFIYAAVGIHPGDVKDAPADYQEQLEQLIKQPKVVAVGEIGLDYHYEDNAPRDVQIAFFETQLQLANQYQLPVIIHDREAHADTMDLLKKYKPKGVVHCFSGSVEMAKEVIKLGMYIGLGGAVTFKNAKKLVETAKEIPLERILVETDSPYLCPEPNRGKRNDSSQIRYVIDKIAAIRGILPEEVEKQTEINARNMYGLLQ